MKPVIYQLVVRYFGNTNVTNRTNGSIEVNGCGKFNDINVAALRELKNFGATHLWLTGVLRQATLTDYPAVGLPADPPAIVKGLAGSLYAICDYFDVSADYASAPEKRMQEFEALVRRIHDAGLLVLIDLVANHVSRGYHSIGERRDEVGGSEAQKARLRAAKQGGTPEDIRAARFTPRPSSSEDTSQFCAAQNHYFYLVSPPKQVLQLPKPAAWTPPGVASDGRFSPEDGSPGHPPKATGNNVTSPYPSAADWYDTVKLNYGFNFVTHEASYDPQPRTWGSVDAILAFWQAKGVDGFRCDFAHYVPREAWTFLISQAKGRRPAYFLAEAYPSTGSGDPIQSQQELIQAGFDAVYHYQAYNALKGIYTDGRLDDYASEMAGQPTHLRAHFASYLENHDERRVASPVVTGGGPGASGFGSAEAGYQLAPLQFLYSSGAALLFNGQEVGEPGAGLEGFGGEDGRTTIFDYWTMPEFAKWVNGLRYDCAGLTPKQKALRHFYAALLRLCQHPAVCGDGFWGLRYFNNPGRFADCPADLYSFARFQPGAGEALLVVANFRVGGSIMGHVRIPEELSLAVKFPPSIAIKLILDRAGEANVFSATSTVDKLAFSGFGVSIPHQTSLVYSLVGMPAVAVPSNRRL